MIKGKSTYDSLIIKSHLYHGYHMKPFLSVSPYIFLKFFLCIAQILRLVEAMFILKDVSPSLQYRLVCNAVSFY